MDEFGTTSDNRGQTDEDILTYTVSDEALEAAAGFGAGDEPSLGSCDYTCLWGPACIS